MTDLERYLQTFVTQIGRDKVRHLLTERKVRLQDGAQHVDVTEGQMAERAVARHGACKIVCMCGTGPKRNGLRLLTKPKWFLYGVVEDIDISYEISSTCAQYVNFLLGHKFDTEKMWQEAMDKYDKDHKNNTVSKGGSALRW